MTAMANAFHVPVGYSDHVLGNEVSLAAVALGTCIIEKHFTLDRTLPGPDHQASMEPDQLAALVAGIRIVESALGDGCKRPAAAEADTKAIARSSLVAAMGPRRGHRVDREHDCRQASRNRLTAGNVVANRRPHALAAPWPRIRC